MDSMEPESQQSSDMGNKGSLQHRGGGCVQQHSVPSSERTPGGRCVQQHSVPSSERTPGGRCVQQHSVPSSERTPGGRCVQQHSVPSSERSPGGRCVQQHSVPSSERSPGGRCVQQHSVPSSEVTSVPACGPVSPRQASMSCLMQTAAEKMHRVDHRVDRSRQDGPSSTRGDVTETPPPSADTPFPPGPAGPAGVSFTPDTDCANFQRGVHERTRAAEDTRDIPGETSTQFDDNNAQGFSPDAAALAWLQSGKGRRKRGRPFKRRRGHAEGAAAADPADARFGVDGAMESPAAAAAVAAAAAAVQKPSERRRRRKNDPVRDPCGLVQSEPDRVVALQHGLPATDAMANPTGGDSPRDAQASSIDAAVVQHGKPRRKPGRPFKRKHVRPLADAPAGHLESRAAEVATDKIIVATEKHIVVTDKHVVATSEITQAFSTDVPAKPRRKPGRPFKRKREHAPRPLADADAPAGHLEARGSIQPETAAAAAEETTDKCGETSEIVQAFSTDVPAKPRRKPGRPFKRKYVRPLADADAAAGRLEAQGLVQPETDGVRAAKDDTTDTTSGDALGQIVQAFSADGTTSARCGKARPRRDQRRPFGKRKKKQTGAVQDPLDARLSATKADALPGTDDAGDHTSKRKKRRAEVAPDAGGVCFSTGTKDALSGSSALPAPDEVQKAQRRKKRLPQTFTDRHNARLSAASADPLTDALPTTHTVQKAPRRKKRPLPQTATDQHGVCLSAEPALPMTHAVQKTQSRTVTQAKDAFTDVVDACSSAAVPNSVDPFPQSAADNKPPRRKKRQSETARRVAGACFGAGVGDGGSPEGKLPDPLLPGTGAPPQTVVGSIPLPDHPPAPNAAAVEGVGGASPEKRRPGRPKRRPTLAVRPEPDAATAPPAEDGANQVRDPVGGGGGEHPLRTLRTRRGGGDGCAVPHVPQNEDMPFAAGVTGFKRRKRKPPAQQIVPGGADALGVGEASAPIGAVGFVGNDEEEGAPVQPWDEEEGAPVQPWDEEEGAPVQPWDEEEGAPVGDKEEGAPVQPRDEEEGAPVGDEEAAAPVQRRARKKRRRRIMWGRKRPKPERAVQRAERPVQRSSRTGQRAARTGRRRQQQQPDDDHDYGRESRSPSATDTAPSPSPCLSTGSSEPFRTAEMLSRVKSEDMETELDYFNPLPPRSKADATRVKAERPNSYYSGEEAVRAAPRKRKARWGRRKQEQRRANPLQSALEARFKREPYGGDDYAPPGMDDRLNGAVIMASGRDGQRYKCPDCGVVCKFLSEYIIHSRVHSGETPYRCRECGRGFNRNSNLTLHMRTHRHKQSRTYQRCPVCHINISCSDFSAHMDKHGGEAAADYERRRYNERRTFAARRRRRRRDARGEFDAEIACKYCGKRFPYPSALERHVRVHTGERPFKCDLCGKGFGQAYFLRVHELSHWSVKRYNCTLCRKAFAHLSSAKKHACLTERRGRRLLAALSYTCHVCKETCPTVESFNRHMRSHAGAKLYRCLLCDKLFGALSEFQLHRAHCGGGAGSLSRAADHEEAKISQEYLLPEPMRASRHGGAPPFLGEADEAGGNRRPGDDERGAVRRTDGPFLSAAVARPPSLLASKLNDLDERSDPRRYFCPSCGRLFRHMGRLRAHMLTHGARSPRGFDCERCSKTLASWAGLWRHQRLHRHRRGRFACPRCARRFRFAAAYRRHVAEQHPEVRWVGARRPSRAPPRPYQCEACSLGFRTLDELFGHQRCHDSPSAHADDDDSGYRLSIEHQHHHQHHHGGASKTANPPPPHVNGYSSAFCNAEPHHQHHAGFQPPPHPPPSFNGGPQFNPYYYYYYYSQHPKAVHQPFPTVSAVASQQHHHHHLLHHPDQYRTAPQPRGTPPSFPERGGGAGGGGGGGWNWTLNHHVASSSFSSLPAGEPSGSRPFVSPVAEPSGSRLFVSPSRLFVSPVDEPSGSRHFVNPVAEPSGSRLFASPVVAEPSGSRHFVSPVAEPSGSRLFVSPVAEPSGSRLCVSPVAEPSGSRLFVSPVAEPSGSRHFVSPVAEPSGSRLCVNHRQHEVSADGIKCAVCGRPFTDVARLYQHYLLHARGQV